ncbi:F-actin-monooxygenase mical2b isoform X6 [Astyanax mexicanus]|uniref:F-actin-monooxygenase mical2b isoform X6 n=1 Tax=Astyanax mexicanus TaxID=7994 RepID=UPI0020CB676A|nr:F-actin-monooxygenase mical2b isoform X6 [Astyanax mexicanus]
MGETEDERNSQASQLFENFVQASTCKGTLQAFSVLCRQLELDPADHQDFYSSLKAAVTSWKAKALWAKLDKRASHKEYKKGNACPDTRCLIIGGGPCGLRTAIELALLGAKVVVIEKRDTFSRNNVLHLWPFTIHDLRNLGAKKFYGKFCAGAIDHISIRQLQLILLKVSLIMGVEVHVNVEFVNLLEPPEDQGNDGIGWRAEIRPDGHPLADYEFDVLIGADGRRSTLDGFKRKEFRGKLAIAITANFVNRNTTAEAKVEEISGVAFIFNQKFFLELKEETGVDLENIVYYKDNTHYFVMTAKKQSLLDKGVIIHDYIETERLLHSDNVNQEALLSYAREAADFGTNYQLPSLDYAINHYGQPDVAMFDFTCMYASENAALIREKNGHQLLVALVGDSLLEPFWPMGTGCARGFLAAFDTVWMVQGWAQGKSPLEVLCERESIYRLLPQTTAENITKNFEQYTIDPATRYPNLNSSCVRPHQSLCKVRHLFINGEQNSCMLEHGGPTRRSVNISRRESEVRPSRLLLWCQKQTQGYRGVDVTDLTTSWRSGLALCALIHRQRPDLIDFDSLNEADCAKNNQLAFEVAERAFGIQPLITGKEMVAEQEPDKLVMVLYLSKFYEKFRNSSLPVTGAPRQTDENNEDYSSKSTNSVYNLMNVSQPRKRVPKDDKKLDDNDPNKKRRKGYNYLEELSGRDALTAGEGLEQKENKVRSMATQLLAKFEENAPSCALRRQVDGSSPAPPAPSPPPKPLSVHSLPACSALSCLLSPPPPPPPQKQCNEDSESQQNDHQRNTDRSEIKRIENLDPSKQRTVGKVSSAIGVKAAALAILYETDHRPNNPVTLSLTEARRAQDAGSANVRREFAPGVGGSDICHFCKKRVYVMERLSAEGYFFHRECFRCDVCSATLRLGGHAFDSDQGTFYCKLHFAQRKTSHRSRKKELPGGSVSLVDGSDGYSATSSLHSQPSDMLGVRSSTVTLRSPVQNSLQNPSIATEAPAEERLVTARIVDSTVQDSPAESESLKPNSPQLNKVERSYAKGGITNRNISWRKKIRNTLPLILVKTLDRSRIGGQDDALIEEDSDFEEIHAPDSPAKSSKHPEDPHCPLQDKQDQAAKSEIPHYRTHGISSPPKPSTSSVEQQNEISYNSTNQQSPKKKLTLSSSEREKLLNWELANPTQFSQAAVTTDRTEKNGQVCTEDQPKPQNDTERSPPLFQIWANVLRRSFSSSVNNPKVIKRNRPPRARPLSEGSFSFSSLFGASTQFQEEEEDDNERKRSRAATEGSQSRLKGRSEITTMLEQVSLTTTKPPGGTKDDMASLPPRKLNFFSSLRLKRNEGTGRGKTDNQTKDILSILSKFRNKASTQQQQHEEDDYSSSEEGPESGAPRSISDDSERQRKKQEKILIQQSKREQLKRLHRAQAIQRQLEEVEEKQRVLEEKGVTLEKVLRGEMNDPSADEAELLQTWFKLVLEKNKLARYESELMIFAQELELEDRQSQLQQELRRRMAVEDCEKSAGELVEEQALLVEVMKAVEERDRLVSLLEEQRLQEKAEDRDLEGLILSKGYQFHWA